MYTHWLKSGVRRRPPGQRTLPDSLSRMHIRFALNERIPNPGRSLPVGTRDSEGRYCALSRV